MHGNPPTALPSPTPLLVPEPEARRLLGNVCAKTLYNLRQSGLPFVKLGSRVMYSPADLAVWIERQKGGAHVAK